MIAIRSYCKSCNQTAKPTSKRTKSTKNTCIIPADERTYVNYSKERLQSYTGARHGLNIAQVLRNNDVEPRFSQPVESVYIRYGDQTRLKDGGNVYIDDQPRWTQGAKRPLYVERMPACLNCVSETRSLSDRFIPRDSSIPSINSHTLADKTSEFRNIEQPGVLSMLLDQIEPSSHTSRSKKPDFSVENTTTQQDVQPAPKRPRRGAFQQPVRCPVQGCSQKAYYRWSESLQRHIKKAHGGEPPL